MNVIIVEVILPVVSSIITTCFMWIGALIYKRCYLESIERLDPSSSFVI